MWFGVNMSLFLIGPWLHALWNRAQEAGPSEAVNVHPERPRRVWEHVAQYHTLRYHVSCLCLVCDNTLWVASLLLNDSVGATAVSRARLSIRYIRPGQTLAVMIIRLLLACACVAGAFRPNALPLRAPVVSHSRIRAPAPVAFTLFEEFKERMTQMTDLRVARASHILLRRRPADEEGGESSTELLERWKQVSAPPWCSSRSNAIAARRDMRGLSMRTHTRLPLALAGDRRRPRGVCQGRTRALGLPEPFARW